jgi:hypothetical protein
MPWEIKQNYGGCSGYAVVKEGTNEIEGCHSTRSEAAAQQRALYASENKSMHDDEEDDKRKGKHRKESHKFWDGTFIEKGYN